jgi:hypothetical protein
LALPSVHGPLRTLNVIDSRDESMTISQTRLAFLNVTVQRVTEDGIASGAPLQVEALIDTGATTSGVDPGLRTALDLEQSEYSERGSGGLPGEEETQLRPLYRLRITIGEKEWDVPVIERMHPDHVTIGCDILQNYRFTYDGLDGDDGSFELYLPD